MANARLVQVLDASDELSIKFGCLFFLKARVSDDEVEKLSTVGIFHDHKEFLISFDDLIELNNVWMAYLLENFDLTCNSLHVFLVVNFVFFEDLDGNFLPSEHMSALFHLAKGALAKSLAKYIMADCYISVSSG